MKRHVEFEHVELIATYVVEVFLLLKALGVHNQ
jgi:hypothetical protein